MKGSLDFFLNFSGFRHFPVVVEKDAADD